MADYATLIPVNVVTGFLGSGKTTLLQRLLKSPRMARTAVLINELGEIGLDHLLVREVDESTVLLRSGCICCTIRDDLNAALRDLLGNRARGAIPDFDRVVIETTGLADPAPILYTLFAEPVLRHHFRLGNVLTTVDAVNGARHIDDNPEGVKQVAVADHLVITKTDLAAPDAVSTLIGTLVRINPSARRFDAMRGIVDPETLLSVDPYDPQTKTDAVRGWLQQEAESDHVHAGHDDHGLRLGDRAHHASGVHQGADSRRPAVSQHGVIPRHAAEIASFSMIFDAPLDWTAFGVWLTMLLNRHGANVLRVKGILNVQDGAPPVVINGVQHLVHPPAHLEAWPSDDHRSRIVFITRGIDEVRLRRSLAAFNRLAAPPASPPRTRSAASAVSAWPSR